MRIVWSPVRKKSLPRTIVNAYFCRRVDDALIPNGRLGERYFQPSPKMEPIHRHARQTAAIFQSHHRHLDAHFPRPRSGHVRIAYAKPFQIRKCRKGPKARVGEIRAVEEQDPEAAKGGDMLHAGVGDGYLGKSQEFKSIEVRQMARPASSIAIGWSSYAPPPSTRNRSRVRAPIGSRPPFVIPVPDTIRDSSRPN